MNGFPPKIVRRFLRKNSSLSSRSTEDNKQPTLYLPYIRGVSEQIEHLCRTLKVRTVFKSSTTLRGLLVHVKNRIPQEQIKGIVYEIPCKDCDFVYIGETGRTLKKRVTEHKLAVKKADDNNGLAVHVWKNSHSIDWDGAKTRFITPYYWKRRVTEAIQIQQHNHTMNLDCGLFLSPIWKQILPSLREATS